MLDLKNKSHAVTAQVTIPKGGAHGVIINEGGQTGGWVLYLDDDGKLVYHYNFLGMQRTSVRSSRKVPRGSHQVRMAFAYAGAGIGKGGTATLFIDGKKVGSTKIERTHASTTRCARPAGSVSTAAHPRATTTPPTVTGSPATSTGSASRSAPTATTTCSIPTRSSTSR